MSFSMFTKTHFQIFQLLDKANRLKSQCFLVAVNLRALSTNCLNGKTIILPWFCWWIDFRKKKDILSPWCLVLSCSTYKGEIMYTTKWFLQWNVFWFSSTPWTLYIFYNVAPLVISWFINPMNILVIQPSLWELCHLCSPTNRNFVATGAPLCTYCLFSYSSYIYI